MGISAYQIREASRACDVDVTVVTEFGLGTTMIHRIWLTSEGRE